MATYNLRRFSSPGALKRIESSRLIELFNPFRDFFAERKVYLPAPGDLQLIPYKGLVDVLMSPASDMPTDLLDALYFIHELSTDEAMDTFLEDDEIRELAGETPTPSDVAVLVWLRDRKELEKKHAEVSLRRPRSFDYFLAKTNGGLGQIDSDRIKALEARLARWFLDKKRGRGCRVLDYRRNGELWLLVRHGAPFRREGSLDEGKPSSVYYRPEKFDVLVYDGDLGELRMNTRSKREKDLYREAVGLHIFGSTGHFPSKQKYTLEPLRDVGRESLACGDIEGLDWITLKEIHYIWYGRISEIETHRAEDVFAVFEARKKEIPKKPRLSRANFQVKFADSTKTRAVSIRPPNVAQYARNEDCELIEKWLMHRGFILNGAQN